MDARGKPIDSVTSKICIGTHKATGSVAFPCAFFLFISCILLVSSCFLCAFSDFLALCPSCCCCCCYGSNETPSAARHSRGPCRDNVTNGPPRRSHSSASAAFWPRFFFFCSLTAQNVMIITFIRPMPAGSISDGPVFCSSTPPGG